MQGRFAWREWIRGRTAAMLACLMLLSCHAATLLAGERPPTSSSSANQDELEQILDRWEHAVGELECLEANFVLWRYDSVFGDSSRSEGRLYYEKPGSPLRPHPTRQRRNDALRSADMERQGPDRPGCADEPVPALVLQGGTRRGPRKNAAR